MKVPESHLDLLTGDIKAVLTTMTQEGQPQSAFAICDYDENRVLIRLPKCSPHFRNMLVNPKLSVTVLDPEDDTRWLGMRGRVESYEELEDVFLFRVEPRRVIDFKDS